MNYKSFGALHLQFFCVIISYKYFGALHLKIILFAVL